MVRKRIGDLLREEAQQPVDREGAPVTEEDNAHTKQDDEVEEELPPVNIPAAKSKSTESETTVNELKKLLQAAQKTETSLQAQITDLKSQLQDQKKLVKELQTQASQEKHLKTELEEAKKTILKLAEASSQPTNAPAKTANKLVPSKSARTEKLPNYADPSERPNTTLANKDIGWFD